MWKCCNGIRDQRIQSWQQDIICIWANSQITVSSPCCNAALRALGQHLKCNGLDSLRMNLSSQEDIQDLAQTVSNLWAISCKN